MNKLKFLAQTAAVVAVFSITPVVFAEDAVMTTSAPAPTDDSQMMQTTIASDDSASTQTMSDSDAMMQMQPAGNGTGVQTTATAAEGNFDATAEVAPASEATANRTTMWLTVAAFVAGLAILVAAILIARRPRA